ncbi:hypothetical protein A3K86_02805 [Photobacterium jeanii]|uniref:DUF3306 domain-containing protein n=1 Tax=Photobacterium jeanii TaxID=858640 RepID=A0A178KM84_9GAMM|nr:DUF3306 domain-containing protein [Photobacterium jeanii]OAN17864.1 hypothetical protein A3K86_02805 [Photobacterium jeanii]PST92468.1 DUF3306 domain-containing protein [Photobacterium jeanii]
MATNFFQRWSSRKLSARQENVEQVQEDVIASDLNETSVDLPSADGESQAMAQTNTLEAAVESEAIVETQIDSDGVIQESELSDEAPSLNDVEKVNYQSGAAAFLKQGVEKSVKKAALRKLFHSDEFNYISDMDDHTEDFSNVPKLDTSVVKQLRNWVNEAAEKVEALAETDVDNASTSATASAQTDTLGQTSLEVGTEANLQTGVETSIPTEVTQTQAANEIGQIDQQAAGEGNHTDAKTRLAQNTETDSIDESAQASLKESDEVKHA